MQTIITYLRQVLGSAPTYFTIGQSNSPQWNYGQLLEYMIAGCLLVLTVSFVFKFVLAIVRR